MHISEQKTDRLLAQFNNLFFYLAYDPETWLDQLLRDDRFKVIVVCSQVSFKFFELKFREITFHKFKKHYVKMPV